MFHGVLGFFRSFWPFGIGNYQRMRRKLIFRHLFCGPLDKSNDGYGDEITMKWQFFVFVVMRSCPLTLHFSQICDSNAATKKSISLTTSSNSTTIIVWDVAFLKSWLYLVNICCTCFVWTSRRSVILSSQSLIPMLTGRLASCWLISSAKATISSAVPMSTQLSVSVCVPCDFFSAVSICVAVSAVESVENKFSRLAHHFFSAEEASTAFFWCLGILLTRLAHSLAQKPQENQTLL